MNFTTHKYATLDVYLLCRFLGRGSFSKVKLGFNTITKQYRAIKIIKHHHKNYNLDHEKKEITIHNYIQHPNAVQLIDYIETDYIKKNGNSYKVSALILEYLPGPQLYQYISVSGRFHERIARTLFHKLINVLEHCHFNCGVTHRDIKPENIMFTPNNFDLKLVDFGVSEWITGREGNGQLDTTAGSRAYMAPEMHLGVSYNGASADLFSAAVTLFIMVSGIRPFAKAERNDTLYHLLVTNRQETFWAAHERLLVEYGINNDGRFYSTEFKSLMNSMLAFDPSMRLALPEVKAHPWYNGETADDDEIKAEFGLRKKDTERSVQAIREQQKQIKKLQALL